MFATVYRIGEEVRREDTALADLKIARAAVGVGVVG
jgi:hypothetical protein